MLISRAGDRRKREKKAYVMNSCFTNFCYQEKEIECSGRTLSMKESFPEDIVILISGSSLIGVRQIFAFIIDT